jgi:hypothetical protein
VALEDLVSLLALEVGDVAGDDGIIEDVEHAAARRAGSVEAEARGRRDADQFSADVVFDRIELFKDLEKEVITQGEEREVQLMRDAGEVVVLNHAQDVSGDEVLCLFLESGRRGVGIAIERGGRSRGLMEDVGELVREEMAAGLRGRLILALIKDNIGATGVGARVDSACGLRSLEAGVDTNAAEIAAETRLEEGSAGGVQRVAASPEDVMHSACRSGRGRSRG